MSALKRRRNKFEQKRWVAFQQHEQRHQHMIQRQVEEIKRNWHAAIELAARKGIYA